LRLLTLSVGDMAAPMKISNMYDVLARNAKDKSNPNSNTNNNNNKNNKSNQANKNKNTNKKNNVQKKPIKINKM